MQWWRRQWWFTQAFFSKYHRQIVYGVLMAIIISWAFPLLVPLLPQFKPSTTIGRVGLYSFDQLPNDILNQISVGLTTLDATGKPQPALAERWSVEEDGKVYRFILQEGVRWQDGKTFTAQDVEYNFADVQVVRSNREVVFRLPDAYSGFPAVVSQPLLREGSAGKGILRSKQKVIGLGDYQVLQVQQQAGLVTRLVIENSKERLLYHFYPSEAAAITALRLGQVEQLQGLASLQELRENEVEHAYSVEDDFNPNAIIMVMFNASDPNLSKEMRQSLNYATKKPDASSSLLRALSPIPPTSWAYNETDEVNPFSYDLERALQLYQSIQPAQETTLKLTSTLALLPIAQEIASNWEEMGTSAMDLCRQGKQKWFNDGQACERWLINTEVQLANESMVEQAMVLAREAPLDPDQYSWWHSTQTGNLGKYQNPRVDKLLEDARTETDTATRQRLLFELQRYLVEDVPAIFFAHLPSYTVSRKKLL